MRKSSYISKTVSDSVLGLALLAAPMTYLVSPANDSQIQIADDESSESTSPLAHHAVGHFLETEIQDRIERVSGKKLDAETRMARSRAIALAITEASETYHVDPFLLLGMIEVESRYNVNAVGTQGELGLMQIKPATAQWIAPVTDALFACDLHEIRCNIMSGARYMSHIQTRTQKRRAALIESASITGGLSNEASLREHVLRSYNLGPAKADRLSSDRGPASRDVLPYASKIASRADRMRSRFTAARQAANRLDSSRLTEVAIHP